MHRDLERILLSESEINAIITRIAAELDRDYAGSDNRLVLLCILKGSVVFMGELMKKITVPVEIDFMRVSSYGGGTEGLNFPFEISEDGASVKGTVTAASVQSGNPTFTAGQSL